MAAADVAVASPNTATAANTIFCMVFFPCAFRVAREYRF